MDKTNELLEELLAMIAKSNKILMMVHSNHYNNSNGDIMSEEMKDKIEELESRIAGLENDLDDLHSELESVRISSKNMRELMEEVAKLANQPVGMMFDYRA